LLKISSRVGFGEGVNIHDSSMVLLMTFPNVVTGQIVSMFMVPSSQLIWGLCSFNHGSPRIISSFLRSVMRNLVGMFCFPIFRFNQVQCLMTPDLFLVPSTFSGMMFLSRGARAIFRSRTNFLLMKVPSAPESIRAFVLNHMSAFLPSPCTSNGTINDLLFSFTSSTGEIEMESGAGANVEIGCFFKNPCFQGHWQVCFSRHQRVLYISP